MDCQKRGEIAQQVGDLLESHDPAEPGPAADRLRHLWLQFEPKSMDVIKTEQRTQQETAGIAAPVLKSIGLEIGRPALSSAEGPALRNSEGSAPKRVADYLPLTYLLWDRYGRKGCVVAVHPLGMMELAEPDTVIPVLMESCRTCLTWEDADQLAVNALEPIVRKDPYEWLMVVGPWPVLSFPMTRLSPGCCATASAVWPRSCYRRSIPCCSATSAGLQSQRWLPEPTIQRRVQSRLSRRYSHE